MRLLLPSLIADLASLCNLETHSQIANPYAHTSDSFYFVDGKLVMHNKAAYAYAELAV